MAFDLGKLFEDVFDPQAGEVVLVACDLPRRQEDDTPAWADRRAMASEWRDAMEALGRTRGFTTLPLLTYTATGANNAELPATGTLGYQKVELGPTLLGSTLALFLTQYSATAPLDGFTRHKEDFRAASMPGLARAMQDTALAADYREVARRCRILAELLDGADAVEVRFSTGDECRFDVRFRRPEADDGFLPRFKPGDRIINLPSGETFIVPYEGERPDAPSRTEGILPVQEGGELARLRVEGNRIVAVEGDGELVARLTMVFAADPARRNVAEVAFGCNDRARVWGNVLEDEKAGFHWAYGRSDHLGGVVGVAAFSSPAMVVHQDIVYAAGNPIQVLDAVVVRGEQRTPVMRDGQYVVF
ncbi:MAG TPA: hypothetical protein P5234_00440 [Thermoanaerobaculaceae bacterium]|nr:hypothetical protein [Thermoanaerobaculaceae bacterium]HRS14695.1 hypothetical protein [Thermoanaerobaculaceae bacterium]